jgi:hypothetical protein
MNKDYSNLSKVSFYQQNYSNDDESIIIGKDMIGVS